MGAIRQQPNALEAVTAWAARWRPMRPAASMPIAVATLLLVTDTSKARRRARPDKRSCHCRTQVAPTRQVCCR
eukprot:3450729-Prymnesium_polylepis.1